jgi:hypothetical protein
LSTNVTPVIYYLVSQSKNLLLQLASTTWWFFFFLVLWVTYCPTKPSKNLFLHVYTK